MRFFLVTGFYYKSYQIYDLYQKKNDIMYPWYNYWCHIDTHNYQYDPNDDDNDIKTFSGKKKEWIKHKPHTHIIDVSKWCNEILAMCYQMMIELIGLVAFLLLFFEVIVRSCTCRPIGCNCLYVWIMLIEWEWIKGWQEWQP